MTRSRLVLLSVLVAVGLSGILVYRLFIPRDGIWFTDIGMAAGLGQQPETRAEGYYRVIETMGSGVALIDYDGDGWLDLVIGQGGELPGDTKPSDVSCRLYRNQRDGTFVDVTEAVGLRFTPFVQGLAVGDFDADGHDDLFIAGFGRSALYRNTGTGGFEDVTDAAGVAGSGWPSSCAFADLDGDGFLDLVVVRYLAETIDDRGMPTVRCPTRQPPPADLYGYCPPHSHPPQSDLVYRNHGDGTFVEVSEMAGLSRVAAPGLGVVIADLDGDGLLDIYVANDMQPNHWWRNEGQFRFQESAMVAGLAVGETGEARAGMGIAVGDYDADGRLDLLVTNFQDEPNDLYRQLAAGVFTIATSEAGLWGPSMSVLGFGTGFLDVDNSGELDLFVSNGHINDFRVIGKPFRQSPQLFRNQGTGTFANESADCGRYFQGQWLGRAVAFGDLDNDGDLDIVVTHLDRPPAILRNDSRPGGNFLGLKLESSSRSRSPVGSVVTAHVGDRTIHRTIHAGSSYLASNDTRLLIGLGDAEQVDRLEIRWPGGNEQQLEALPAGSYFEIREGESPQRIQYRSSP